MTDPGNAQTAAIVLKTTISCGLILSSILAPHQASGQAGLIRLSELHPNEQWVELVNSGTDPVDVSDFLLCNFPSYQRVTNTTPITGSTMLEPGAFLVISWASLGQADGELGLYRAGTTNFGDAGSMLDYMEYTSSGHQRESVAVTNAFWETATTVAHPGETKSLSRVDTDQFGAAQWTDTEPSPGAPNQLPTASEQPDDLAHRFELSQAYPNPFNSTAIFSLVVDRPQHVRIALHDVLLREVAVIHDGHLAAGRETTFEVDGAGLPPGHYWYTVSGASFRAARSVVLTR